MPTYIPRIHVHQLTFVFERPNANFDINKKRWIFLSFFLIYENIGFPDPLNKTSDSDFGKPTLGPR